MGLKIKESFGSLTRFEWCLWVVSMVVVAGAYLVAPVTEYITLAASLIGVTSLIFLAKGLLIGQVLVIIFSFLYGVVSYQNAYYGEVLTYVCMTAPMAIVALISWARHPYKDTAEVEVAKVTARQVVGLLLLSVVVTVVFYYILRELGTANIWVSTLSVTTSFVAVGLTALRSPYYAIGYALNDLVLIVLWVMVANVPMAMCFVMFLANDLYGFMNWRRMSRRQSA